MTRKPRRVFVSALPLSSLPQLEELLAPFLGDKGSRGHVVMVRLGDTSVAHLDDLVESGLFGSRSEAAAFLVGAGIQAQRQLFERIATQTSEIKRLRTSLRETALAALGAAGGSLTRAATTDGEKEEAPPRRARRRKRNGGEATDDGTDQSPAATRAHGWRRVFGQARPEEVEEVDRVMAEELKRVEPPLPSSTPAAGAPPGPSGRSGRARRGRRGR